jgi:O-antigen ligase
LFGNSLRTDFLPQQNPTSLHNAYVEIPAETGVVGLAAFAALLFVAVRGIRALLRRTAGDPRASACAWCATVLLVGVLVWWNDNALFGAQPETILAATLLGMLAAIPILTNRPATPYADSASGGPRVPAPR